MINDRDKIKRKIENLEIMLNDFKTALRVIESLEDDEPITLNVIVSTPKKRKKKKTTIREKVINDVLTRTTDIGTYELITIHSERTGLSRTKAGNTIYPIVSNLVKDGSIEGYKNSPDQNREFWKIKNPDANQG